jgi:hypothetical protein
VPGHLEFQQTLRLSGADSIAMARAQGEGGAHRSRPGPQVKRRILQVRERERCEAMGNGQSGSSSVGRMGLNVAYKPGDLNVGA